MFESTLSAQGLNEGERRFGSLSAAVVGHLAIVLAIVGVTAIIVPPVRVKDPAYRLVVPIVQAPPLDLDSVRPAPRPPKKGTDTPGPLRAVIPTPRDTPQRTEVPPDTPPTSDVPPDTGGSEGPGEGARGIFGGSDDGDPDATGTTGRGGGDGDGPALLTGDMISPQRIVKVEPVYPEVPRKARLGGRVTVQAVIGLDGDVESAEVIASSSPLFNQAALSEVKQWRYRPALMNGRPVRVYFTVVVDFSIR